MQLLASSKLKTIIMLAGVITLTACVGPVKKQHDELIGNWKITKIEGRVVNSEKAQMKFLNSGNVTGNNGCNNIMGNYKPVHDHLNLSKLAGTRMACKGEADEIERAFNQSLSKIEHFLVKGQQLFLTNEQDVTVISLHK
ncbi:MAG: heat shock protein HslJ [Oceanospirillaceae bacterium]|jgi:heat shock protein HslJ